MRLITLSLVAVLLTGQTLPAQGLTGSDSTGTTGSTGSGSGGNSGAGSGSTGSGSSGSSGSGSPVAIAAPMSLPKAETGAALGGILGIGISLVATGGTGSYVWTASGCPSGIDVIGAAGGAWVLHGTVTSAVTVETVYPVKLTVADAADPTNTDSVSIDMVVAPTLTLVYPTKFPDAIAGQPYGPVAFEVTGGVEPYSWTYGLTGNDFPPGISVTQTGPKSWAVSGTPPQDSAEKTHKPLLIVGDAYLQVMSVTPPNATTDVKIKIVTALQSDMAAQYNAYVGKGFDLPLEASGGVEGYTWSLKAGSSLPAWMTLESGPQGWRLVGAVPVTETPGDQYVSRLELSDMTYPSQVVDVELTFALSEPLELVATTLPTVVVGKPYTAQLEFSNGSGPWAWVLSGLPQGLGLVSDGSNVATIEGTVSADAAAKLPYTLTMQSNDSSLPPAPCDDGLLLNVKFPVDMLTSKIETATTNIPYSTQLQASGGIAPYTWSATGFPEGVSLDESGKLSGMLAPGQEESYVVAFVISDSSTPPLAVIEKRLFIVGEEFHELSITTSYLPIAVEGESYGPVSITWQGAAAPDAFSWSAIGLPQGLSLVVNAVGNVSLEGVPAVSTAGIYQAQISLTDAGAGQAASVIYALVVHPAANELQETSENDEQVSVPPALLAGAAPAACAMGSGTVPAALLAMVVLIATLGVARANQKPN